MPPQRESTPEEVAAALEVLNQNADVLSRSLEIAASRINSRGAGVHAPADLAQLTITKGLEKIKSGIAPKATLLDMKRWLRGILFNICRQNRRSVREAPGPGGSKIVDPGTSPSSNALRNERTHLIKMVRSSLRPRDREILDMRFHDGLSYEAMGEKVGVSKVAAYRAFQRAIANAKSLYDAFTGGSDSEISPFDPPKT